MSGPDRTWSPLNDPSIWRSMPRGPTRVPAYSLGVKLFDIESAMLRCAHATTAAAGGPGARPDGQDGQPCLRRRPRRGRRFTAGLAGAARDEDAEPRQPAPASGGGRDQGGDADPPP